MPLQEVFEAGLMVNAVNVFADDPTTERQRGQALSELATYADTSFTAENLTFLTEVHKLYKQKGKPDSEALNKLYDMYVKTGAQHEINISSPLRAEIGKKFPIATTETPTLEIFSDAVAEIIKVLHTDVLRRFAKVDEQLQKDAFKEIKDLEERRVAIARAKANAEQSGLNPEQRERYHALLMQAYTDTVSAQFDSIGNLELRRAAIVKAQATSGEIKGLTNYEKERYDNFLKNENEKTTKAIKGLNPIVRIGVLAIASVPRFRKLQRRGRRSVHPVDEVTEQNAPPSDTPLAKQAQTTPLTAAQIRFQAHKFSKIKDLKKRNQAIEKVRQALVNESARGAKSPEQEEYDKLLRDEVVANGHFQDLNFSEIKDLSKREEAIAEAIANAGDTKKTAGMNDEQFKIYKDLLDKELQKTNTPRKGIIDKLKSAVATFLSGFTKKKPAEDTQPGTISLAQPPVVGTPAAQKPESAKPPEDKSTASLHEDPAALPQKPTKPTRVKRDKSTPAPQTTPATPSPDGALLAQRLSVVMGKATPPEPENSAGPPFTTQKAAQSQSTPSIKELANASEPTEPADPGQHKKLETPPPEPIKPPKLPPKLPPKHKPGKP